MKHVIIAVVIGLVTLGASVFLLSDDDGGYEQDAKDNRSISIGETFEGSNYDLKPTSFSCDDFPAKDETDSKYGCVLEVELTNTSIFEQALILDGDKAISITGEEYESSDEFSRKYVANNWLTQDIAIDETVTGGIFFQVIEGQTIEQVDVYESAQGQPIKIAL